MAENKPLEKAIRKSFSKSQLLQSKQYSGVEKNILDITLDETKKYSHNETRKAIDDFKKRKVK